MKQAVTYTRLRAEEREEISRFLAQGQIFGQIVSSVVSYPGGAIMLVPTEQPLLRR